MEKTVLLVIDMQVAMFSFAGMPPYRGEEVLRNIKELLVTTRGSGTPVVYVQHTDGGKFAKETPTWEICPEIAPEPGEKVFQKPFSDSFYKTDLHEALQGMGITRLVVAGMQTEFCVDTTCRRAFSLGYETTLVSDAHTTFDSKILTGEQIVRHHNRILGSNFVTLKTTKEALEML
ncbi:MAG: cysteine hydrolase family protein [Clostridia bacterium]|nr:cysteine hydrolase family protein [Clostridia bacterium]